MSDADAAARDDLTLGAALSAAREAAGMSVEQVSDRTRIRGSVIRDLEADRFASSGAPVYARGHVRAIAQVLGADARPLLDLLTRQLPSADPVVVPGPPPQSGPADAPLADGLVLPPRRLVARARPERRRPNWMLAGLLALVVLAAIAAVGALTGPHPAPAGLAGSSASPAPRTSAPAGASPSTAASPPPAAAGAALSVRVSGGQSWISVSNASGTLFQGVLPDGSLRQFSDPGSLRVVVGNAGAVSLTCGAHALVPAGGAGAVRRFTCSGSGLTLG